jgi:hypothetical protein
LSLFYGKACPDNVYNIKEISTYEELFMHLYDVEGILASKNDADTYFKQLLKILRSSDDEQLKAIILRKVNAQKITIDNLYSLWRSVDDFGKWLIQNYVVMYEGADTYLHKIMMSMVHLTTSEFIEKTYICIFDEADISTNEERRKMILSINKLEKIILSKQIIAYYDKLFCELVRKYTAITPNNIGPATCAIVFTQASLRSAPTAPCI